MAEMAVVRRYTRALFEAAQRAEQIEQVEEDLKGVDLVLRAVPRLTRALRAPTVSTARKKQLVETAFSGRVEALSLRFLRLLVDRKREEVLSEVYADFRKLANDWRKLLLVQVRAAAPLSDEEQAQLAQALQQKTGRMVVLEVTIEPELIGGLYVRYGDTVVDGTLRSRLAQVRARLLASRLF